MLEDSKENHPPLSPAKSRCSTPGSTASSPPRPPGPTSTSSPSPKSEQNSPRTTNFSISSILGRGAPADGAPERVKTPKSPASQGSRSPSPTNLSSPAKAHDLPLKLPCLPPMLHPSYASYFSDKALPAYLAWYHPWNMAAAAAAGGIPHHYMAHLGQQLGLPLPTEHSKYICQCHMKQYSSYVTTIEVHVE